jgi:hypothetical protein
MAIGAKKIETRSWSTTYRGWLAIHASKGGLGKRELAEQLSAPGFALALAGEQLQFGMIVAVAKLVDCAPMCQCDECDGYGGWYEGSPIKTTCPKCWGLGVGPRGYLLTQQEHAFGNYEPGRYAWVTDKLGRLPEPIPYKARQGLYPLDQATTAAIQQQWRRVQ